MKTTFKWLGVVIAGTAVVVLMLAVAVTWLFDSDDFKSRIEALVEKETGYALSINGDLSLSVFPGLGVKVGPTVLRNPTALRDGRLAEFDGMSVRLKLAPLFRGGVEPDNLVIEGLHVRLLQTAAGRWNFDGLLALNDKPGGAAPPAAPVLGGLTLKDAALTYEDQGTGEILQLTDLHLRAGAFSTDAPVPVAARFRFSASMLDTEGEASMDAALLLEPARQGYGAESLALSVTLRGDRIPGGRLDFKANAGARYDGVARSFSMTDLKIVSDNPETGETRFAFGAPTAALDLAARTASMENFSASAIGIDIRGDLVASALPSQPTVSGKIRVARFRPRDLLARLGQPLPEPLEDKLPKEGRFEASLAADREGVILDPIEFFLDDVRIYGRVDAAFAPGLPIMLSLDIEGPSVASGDRRHLTLRGSGRREGASTYAADELALTLGPVTARGTIKVDTGAADPSYTGSFEVPAFDARALLEHLGQPIPITGDPRALTRVGAQATLSGSGARMLLDPLTVDVDETRVEGNLSVSDVFTARRAFHFDLRANALDTGRYLPLEIPESEQESPAFIPLAALQPLNLNGRLRLGALIVGDVIIDRIELTARSRNGQLEVRAESVPRMSRLSERVAGSSPLTAPAP